MTSYVCTYCNTLFELTANERLMCPLCGSKEVKRADTYLEEPNKYKKFLKEAEYEDFFKHFLKNEMRVEIKLVVDRGGRLVVHFFDKRYMESARHSAREKFKEEIVEFSSLVSEITGEFVHRIGLRESLNQYVNKQNTLEVRQEIRHNIIKRLQMSYGRHFVDNIRTEIMKRFGADKYEE